MASEKLKQWKADPNDLFPYRGQYGGAPYGALFFIATRFLLVILTYSVLVSPTSPWSLFLHFPYLTPSRPPPADDLSLPGIPSSFRDLISHTLNMTPQNTIIFLTSLLSSIEFSFYNALWRREKFPMTGQGGSLMISTQVQIIDAVQVLLYVYTASRNPTWLPEVFRWMPLVVAVFVGVHGGADHSKWVFRRDGRNDGKIYGGGLFRVVRHPNFLGFFVWRVAFAVQCGGLLLAGLLAALFVNIFRQTSMPGLEGYLAIKYGRQWELYKENVKWRIFPGVY